MNASKEAQIVIRADKTGFPDGSVLKSQPANAGDSGSPIGDARLISESGRSPGGGNGNLFQNSCLVNPMDRAAWWATIQGITESNPTEGQNTHTRKFLLASAKMF